MTDQILQRLASTITARRAADATASYTKQLLEAGPKRCAKKLGEEATELVIAALAEDDDALRNEAADVIYHLLVVLECRNVAIADVLGILESRMGTSGHAEKAARKP